MDRLSHLRGEAGGSRDTTLDTTSPPSESFMTANESSSKYFSLSEVDTVDSTFDISSIKDVSLASTTTDSEGTMTNADELISNLSPIGKKNDMLDSYKIGKQISAANILSGGVDIFEDNDDNSYDGDELVIDDNVDDKSNSELKQPEEMEFKSDENMIESTLINEATDIASKDTEVVLQIDGKNVDAIDIGNGLYLYRKEGQEELAAVQIIEDDQQQTSFKFLKVRENTEGNLEVYEEIEIEVPKEVPAKEWKMAKKISSHVPIKDINKVISESACNKVAERKIKTPRKEPILTTTITEVDLEFNKETSPDGKSEVNINGKMMKFSESRKSPVIGSFTPMTYHSTPNKEPRPLTKTMVDQQLHPNRHSDNVKKTIEVHTDSSKQRTPETPTKNKNCDYNKTNIAVSPEKELVIDESIEKNNLAEEPEKETIEVKNIDSDISKPLKRSNNKVLKEKPIPNDISVSIEQDNVIDSTEKDVTKEKAIFTENIQSEIVNEEKKEEMSVIIDDIEESMDVDLVIVETDVETEVYKGEAETEELTKVDKSEVKTEEVIKADKDETKTEEVVKADKDEANTEDLVKTDKGEELVKADKDEAKMNIQSQTEVKTSVPIQVIINKDVEIDVTDNSVKAIVKDNTQCDSQDETKVEEIIYDITDQDTDEIIIIDDSELDESNIIETTAATDNDETEDENIKINNPEIEKVETNIVKKNEDESEIKERVQDNSKKCTANVQADSAFAVVLDEKEQVKKDETLIEVVKNNQSNIPVAKSETKKEVTTPTATSSNQPPTPVDLKVGKVALKPEPAKKTGKEGKVGWKPEPSKEAGKIGKVELKSQPAKETDKKVGMKLKPSKETGKVETVELKPEPSKEKGTAPKEVAKEVILNKDPSQPSSTPEQSQKPVKPHKNPFKLEVVPVALNKTPVHISPSITKTETEIPKKEINVHEKSPKKDLKKPIPIAESQSNAVSMEVDSTTNIKAEASGKCSVSSGKIFSKDVKEQKPVAQEASGSSCQAKPEVSTKEDEKQEIKITPIASSSGEGNVKDIKIRPVPKEEQPSCSGTQDVSSTSTDSPNERNEGEDDSEEPKPGGSKKAVPFGKWTATNRKEFLNKIKNRNTVVTPAVPSTSSNQLKNSNDLNRRDVLQKIDSQRQQSSNAAALAKTQEGNKAIKNETAFVSKASVSQNKDNTQESKIPLKVDTAKETSETEAEKAPVKQDVPNDIQNEEVIQAATATSLKKEAQRTEVNYQDLIDKTIEDMIHRKVGPTKPGQDDPNQNSAKDSNAPPTGKFPANYQPPDQATLDEIEMKMNELHGIPFIERPPHELPVVPLSELKPKAFTKAEKEKPAPIKTTKIPNLLPFENKTQQKITKENVIEVDSEDEIIEHEPITGDIDLNKKNVAAKLPPKEKVLYANTEKSNADASKKESIITEKDFDKFARRNSKTYENCLTVNFDSKEPHNVVQNVVEKDPYPKTYSRNDVARVDPKSKIPHKYQNVRQPIQPVKVHASNKLGTTEDSSTRNQSKLQKAYQSALSAKRQKECPITIIEDKPVKVVFMDNMEFVPSSLNIQGQQLSPAKKVVTEPDSFTLSTLDSLDSDALDTTDDAKSQEEVKIKTKHQRKQVLTPVDEPELELIQPKDLGLEVSPKKKRKVDDDKNLKYPMRKKYYLLGSNTAAEDKYTNTPEVIKNPLKETVNRNDNGVAHKNAVSAIDSLVKAAELLEHSENLNIIDSPTPDSQQSTPVKRGRGRPRKYPLPEGGVVEKNKVPSPQKKPRLIDAKVSKRDPVITTDDEDDDEDSDGQIIKENWTMGKINENIVCPICNKLFRTENVVFKHVKHCTGPSPSRSGSDKRSPRRMRPSQESDSKSQGSKSDDMDLDDDKPLVVRKETPKKRKSKDSVSKSEDKDDIIVIEDTPPVKEKAEKKETEVDERKIHESRKPRAKIFPKTNDLICEFCGKTFRQLSYLVSHKLQHKKDEPKKVEKETTVANKSVYSCEVCKKEFRKLHHLVQHRIIHNPSSAPARSLRKSSSEQSDTKVEKEPGTSKLSEDPSAGFRCEPCDKSFRKLHHLVEHRETHDGINRQKTTPTVVPTNIEKIEKVVEKPVTLHQCEVCKKTFRKLHHLIEHKEQHVETSSEKSDDKSVKSSLSTRDIIHECSLCYMVFPNEHSLNKHTIICQRKKRQSKQAKPADEEATAESVEDTRDIPKVEEKLDDIDSTKLVIIEDIKEDEPKTEVVEMIDLHKEIPKAAAKVAEEKPVEVVKEVEKDIEPVPQKIEIKPVEPPISPTKRDFTETEVVKTETKPEVPEKKKKVEIKEAIKVLETPKKKISNKEKSTGSASKRLKTTPPVPVQEEPKPAVESSDDDEVRYMLNPNFKVEEPAEEKVFMKVRANKRSSLQIERPHSKDLVKRRTSLQHPPKIPRLKPKAIEPNPVAVKHVVKAPKLEPIPSTDSDDSETVKYSFPKTIPEKATKPAQERTPKTTEKKTQKKTLADKRKSLSGIAKRKSLGKVVTAKHKPSPMKQIKKRTLEVEHRCDCGQLFSSAALLSRHTTLAHTPPRIRRRRSPPPAAKPDLKPDLKLHLKPDLKPAPRKSSVAEKPKQAPAKRKSSARSDSGTSTITKPNKSEAKPTRKSLDKETKSPAATRKPKPEKSEAKSSVKPKRTPAHRGVPVPEKMRKLMKNNK